MEESKNIIEITNKEQFTSTVAGDKLTIVDFWAEWCGPCRMMIPVLHKIANDHQELQLATVNVDQCQDLALEYDVNSIPAVFLMKSWKIVDSFVWALPEDEVLKKIQSLSV